MVKTLPTLDFEDRNCPLNSCFGSNPVNEIMKAVLRSERGQQDSLRQMKTPPLAGLGSVVKVLLLRLLLCCPGGQVSSE